MYLSIYLSIDLLLVALIARSFVPRKRGFGSQMDLLGAPGASKLKCWTALGLQNVLLALQVDVLERFGPPCWGSGRAFGLQLGGLGAAWASKLGSSGGSGPPSSSPWEALGSQMRLQRTVLGLRSQLQNVFGCTFAMLWKT